MGLVCISLPELAGSIPGRILHHHNVNQQDAEMKRRLARVGFDMK